MSTVADVPRESRRSARPLQPIPAGYRVAFDNLKQALTLPTGTLATPVVEWQSWQVVERTNGFHVARETRDGLDRQFLLNSVGKVKIFRQEETAQAAAAQANSPQAQASTRPARTVRTAVQGGAA